MDATSAKSLLPQRGAREHRRGHTLRMMVVLWATAVLLVGTAHADCPADERGRDDFCPSR